MSGEPEIPKGPIEEPPEPLPPVDPSEERILALEKEIADLKSKLNELPKDLEGAFTNYHTKVIEPRLASLAKSGGGGSSTLGELLDFAKVAFGGGGGDTEFQQEVQEMTKQVVSLALKGSLQNMRKAFGVPDHVLLE